MDEMISDPPVSWLLEARDRHCPTTNFLASLRCNRNVATGYLDEEESRAFAAAEGTGLVYSFPTFTKEDTKSNGAGKEGKVQEVPMSFNTFACALCRAPPTGSTTFLCEAALYVDCCKGIERQQMVQVEPEADAADGEHSVLWLVDKTGERVRTLDRVLVGLLRHCFPLVVLRLPASLPTPYLKEKHGVVVEDVLVPQSDPSCRLVVLRRASASSALARLRLAGDAPSVQSQRQFQYVWELGGEARRRLERIVCGAKVGSDDAQSAKMLDVINRLVPQGAKDAEIYAELYRVYLHQVASQRREENGSAEGEGAAAPAGADKGCGCTAGGGERAQARVKHIIDTLPREFKTDSVLDIGCADGSITVELGKKFGVPRGDIHGCDVRDMAVQEGNVSGKGQGEGKGDRGFEFTLLRGAQCRGGDLPYEDNSFGLVTLLMTLHHLEDQLEALWEIERLLKPNGIVVIREHQCNEPGLDVVLDIMHGLYALVWGAVPESPNFIQEYFALYRPREEWSDLMKDAGLARVHWVPRGNLLYDYAEPHPKKTFDMVQVNPSKAYYAAYQKKPKSQSPPERGRGRVEADKGRSALSTSQSGHDWRHDQPRETERVPLEEPARPAPAVDRKRSRSPEKEEASSSDESSTSSKGLSKKEKKRLKKDRKRAQKEKKKEEKKRRKEEKKRDR